MALLRIDAPPISSFAQSRWLYPLLEVVDVPIVCTFSLLAPRKVLFLIINFVGVISGQALLFPIKEQALFCC